MEIALKTDVLSIAPSLSLCFGEQGWRSGESTRLPPMWPGFKSRRRRHMWVEFVVSSLPCSERFFSGYFGFPLSSKTNIFQFQIKCLDNLFTHSFNVVLNREHHDYYTKSKKNVPKAFSIRNWGLCSCRSRGGTGGTGTPYFSTKMRPEGPKHSFLETAPAPCLRV